MAASTINTITLSGSVTNNRYVAAPGDIYLYRNDDRQGASYRRGRHTNYGYSGYYLASVFDGQKWRKLQFNDMVAYENRSYEYASESGRVYNYLMHVVSSWRGRYVQYSTERRAFI
ncbi:hypothetical protein [Enterobacter roggenkampii]|uniref:hypothetical protein n=1 Tax=Enterobacter roggenkampii TaxID=1812935 RepID=UPI001F174A0B|nr:hypothetical protein [Enterobacter roggenkampii]MCE5966871.1 hypothetical protein [Enterobacter roggenkampii]MCE5971303.1 hypothetical protein [Enterobacter roggenkampii]UHY21704.1 hypothetical protein LL005_16995 [Enterobacter roggenkampii]